MGKPAPSRSKVKLALKVNDEKKGIEIYEAVLDSNRFTIRLEGWGKRVLDGYHECKWWRWVLIDHKTEREVRSHTPYKTMLRAKMLLVREITMIKQGNGKD